MLIWPWTEDNIIKYCVPLFPGGLVVDGGFDPDVLDADFADLLTTGHRGGGNTAGGGKVGRCIDVSKATCPVAEVDFGDVNGAMHIAGGDLGGAQQGDGEAGDVKAVAAPTAEGEVGVLHGAPGGLPFDVVAYPVVNSHGIVVELRGFVFDGLAEADFGRGGQIGGVASTSEFVEGEVAQGGQLDVGGVVQACAGEVCFLLFGGVVELGFEAAIEQLLRVKRLLAAFELIAGQGGFEGLNTLLFARYIGFGGDAVQLADEIVVGILISGNGVLLALLDTVGELFFCDVSTDVVEIGHDLLVEGLELGL